jgi:hypothetical protein
MIGIRIANIITPAVLNAAQIDNTAVADNSISTAKLQQDSVTQDKLANDIDVSHLINDAGYISDLTGFTTDDVTEGSTKLYYTDARAIAAVEGEPTIELGNITHSGAWSITCDNDITLETTTAGDFTWLKTDKTYVGSSSGFFLTNGNEIDTWGGATEVVLKKRVVAEDVIVVDNQAADPTGVTAGSIYFNTTSNKFRGYNGTVWVDLG